MDGTITKGVILSIEGNTAKVAPMKDTRLVSPNIQIADNIDAGNAEKGAAVAYVCFEDDTASYLHTELGGDHTWRNGKMEKQNLRSLQKESKPAEKLLYFDNDQG